MRLEGMVSKVIKGVVWPRANRISVLDNILNINIAFLHESRVSPYSRKSLKHRIWYITGCVGIIHEQKKQKIPCCIKNLPGLYLSRILVSGTVQKVRAQTSTKSLAQFQSPEFPLIKWWREVELWKIFLFTPSNILSSPSSYNSFFLNTMAPKTPAKSNIYNQKVKYNLRFMLVHPEPHLYGNYILFIYNNVSGQLVMPWLCRDWCLLNVFMYMLNFISWFNNAIIRKKLMHSILVKLKFHIPEKRTSKRDEGLQICTVLQRSLKPIHVYSCTVPGELY